MKRLLFLLFLLSCLLLGAAAESSNIQIQVSIQKVAYSFALEGENYAYVQVTTPNDVGKQLLYSENGHFSGSMALPNCYESTELIIDVMKLNGNRVYRETAETAAVIDADSPAPQDDSIPVSSKVTNMVVTPYEGGFEFSFQVMGRDEMYLHCKTAHESHTIRLYAHKNYTFDGRVDLPLSFPYDSVTYSVITVNSSQELYKDSCRLGYSLPPTAEKAAQGRLSGVTVCIDPGHQEKSQEETVQLAPNLNRTTTTKFGMATGMITKRRESIVVLEIGQLLRNALLAEGADVVMTRESQEDFVGMIERADIPNNANADFVLRLHCNNRDDSSVQGIAIYCPYQSSYAKAVADEDAYREMGFTLLRAMQAATGQNRGSCKLTNNYVGNNWSKMPSFLIELGYLSNRSEDLLICTSPEYQQKLVDGMVEGVYQLSISRGLITPAAQ